MGTSMIFPGLLCGVFVTARHSRGYNTLSVKRNLSLLQSDIHRNPLHQNDSYLDTDQVNLCLISTSKKQKFTSIKEEINAMKSQEVNFQKSQKLLASRAGSSKQTIAHTAFT